MGKINFHRQFVTDLVKSGDAQLPNRVLRKVFTDTGDFRTDRDDHQYKGIDDAWIRVVSRGSTAYRVIYLRQRDEITLYRAGPHSVEDNLASPGQFDGFSVVSQNIMENVLRPVGGSAASQELARARKDLIDGQPSRFAKNHENLRLYEKIAGRRLLPHKEVIFVSPYISFDLIASTQMLGQMLDEWVCDECTVTFITRPPNIDELPGFDQLESRGFSILYVPRLHAKAYMFKVDRSKLSEFQENAADLALIGSADLTNFGFNPSGSNNEEPQLELSYQINVEDQDELDGFLAYLASVSISHDVVRNNLSGTGAKL